MIASRNNQKLKMVRKLLKSPGTRRQTGLFIAEGTRLFSEVPAELMQEVFASEEFFKLDPSAFENCTCSLEVVEDQIFRQLSDTVNPQGVLAVVRQPDWSELIKAKGLPAAEAQAVCGNELHSSPEEKDPGKILLLDGIRDPGNMGTMIRTAEAAGVRAVYMSEDCVDLYNPKVIRSTMGSIFRVITVRADLENIISQLKQSGIKVYAASLKAEKTYKEADMSGSAIIIGSEAAGVSEAVMNAATDLVIIPMAGKVESLNAAVAAAVLMFC